MSQDYWKKMWEEINEAMQEKEEDDTPLPMWTTESNGRVIDLRRDPDAAAVRPNAAMNDDDDEYLASLLGE